MAQDGTDSGVRAGAGPDVPGAAGPGGLRARMRTLSVLEQEFARHVATELGVDAAGQAAMYHLGMSGTATPTEIARQLGISTAATTLVLNRLEAAGHLSRKPHATDRRKVVVVPAAASLAAAYELVRPVIDGVEEVAGSMTPDEQAVVTRFLDQMIEVYERGRSARHPGTDAG